MFIFLLVFITFFTPYFLFFINETIVLAFIILTILLYINKLIHSKKNIILHYLIEEKLNKYKKITVFLKLYIWNIIHIRSNFYKKFILLKFYKNYITFLNSYISLIKKKDIAIFTIFDVIKSNV